MALSLIQESEWIGMKDFIDIVPKPFNYFT
jgi:hypothetical protein